MKKWEKYLRRNSIYLILFFSLLGLSQCDFIGNLRDKNRKEVFDPYDHPLIEIGDMLVFKNEENIDSFFVIESNVFAPYELDDTNEDELYYARLHQVNCIDTTCIEFGVRITVTYYSISCYLNNVIVGKPGRTLDFVSKVNGGNHLFIGNYELNELHKIYLNYIPDLTVEIDSVLYSKAYGIIKYWRKNQQFEITQSTLEMLMARDK